MNSSLKSNLVVVLVAGIFVGLLLGPVSVTAGLAAQNTKIRQPEQHSAAIKFPGDSEHESVDVEIGQSANFRFAVVGDYGSDSTAEADVASLVKSWAPAIILTTGDNNYPDGAAETIDANIGKHYREFISPYLGSYGDGALVNRFFPSLGNHDWHADGAQPYLDYFTLPGNERYYDFIWGLVHFFVIDSNSDEPDGNEWDSVQANWLQTKLANSTYPWKIVVLHHAPYSSGRHGSNADLQWPYADWGADVVFAGHDHTYERISPPDDILYFVNGLGGNSIYGFSDIVEGSQLRYNEDYGAMLVDVSIGIIRFRFINRQGEVIDDFDLVKPLTYFYLPILQKSAS